MAFQAGCLISVVPGGPDLEMEIRPCNVHCDLYSLLQTLQRQEHVEPLTSFNPQIRYILFPTHSEHKYNNNLQVDIAGQKSHPPVRPLEAVMKI